MNNTCTFCNWTNTGTVQVNKPGQPPRFICANCIQRKLEALDQALAEKGRLAIKVMDQNAELERLRKQ